MDYPVAKALAAECIAVPPFAAMDEAAMDRARAVMTRCEQMVCCLDTFGELNQGNRRLRDEAAVRGKILKVSRLSDLWTGGER